MNSQKFAASTDHLLACITYDPSDRETIRRFLCQFAAHVIKNISPMDFDRASTEEIIESISEMEEREGDYGENTNTVLT
jgi:hypothetical protein